MNYLVGYLRGEALLSSTPRAYSSQLRWGQTGGLERTTGPTLQPEVNANRGAPEEAGEPPSNQHRQRYCWATKSAFVDRVPRLRSEEARKKSGSYETLLGPMIMRSMPPVMREKYADDATNEITDYGLSHCADRRKGVLEVAESRRSATADTTTSSTATTFTTTTKPGKEEKQAQSTRLIKALGYNKARITVIFNFRVIVLESPSWGWWSKH